MQVEERGLLDIDRVAAHRQDHEARVGDAAPHEEAGLEAGLVLVAHHHERRDRQPPELGLQLEDRLPPEDDAPDQVRGGRGRVLAEVPQELVPSARVLRAEDLARGDGAEARHEDPYPAPLNLGGEPAVLDKEPLAVHGAAAAAGDDEARGHLGMPEAEVQGDVTAHRQPPHVGA